MSLEGVGFDGDFLTQLLIGGPNLMMDILSAVKKADCEMLDTKHSIDAFTSQALPPLVSKSRPVLYPCLGVVTF